MATPERFFTRFFSVKKSNDFLSFLDNEQVRTSSHHNPPLISQVIPQQQNGHHSYAGNQPDAAGSDNLVDDLSFSQERISLLSNNSQENATATVRVLPPVRRLDQPSSSASSSTSSVTGQHHHYHRTSSRLTSSGSSMGKYI